MRKMKMKMKTGHRSQSIIQLSRPQVHSSEFDHEDYRCLEIDDLFTEGLFMQLLLASDQLAASPDAWQETPSGMSFLNLFNLNDELSLEADSEHPEDVYDYDANSLLPARLRSN